ncbi:MAG: flavodoxin [Prevotella sp.]|nr:flavodoxin [Prevotella sp.]
MKHLLFILMSLFMFSCSSNAQNAQSDANILVAYFSCTGTTENVAKAIADAISAQLYQITPATAYTSADLNWQDSNSRSSVEMKDDNSRPELAGEPLDISNYDVVFIGYPIWWDLCPRAVNTFIEKYDFSSKTVIPFATSGSSAISNSAKQLQKLYPNINWQEGKLLNGGAKQAAEWSKQLTETH